MYEADPTTSTRARALTGGSRDGGAMIVLLVIAAALVAAWKLDAFSAILEGKEEVAIEGAEVRQGDLRISEVVKGNLEATDSVTLKAEVEGRSTIIFLEEEGTMVKEGDLVAELDVSQLEDDLVRQEIEVKNAEANYTKAREQYDIQVIQNVSDIAAAELAHDLAELDLAKYVGVAADDDLEEGEDGESGKGSPGEWDNELASAEETVLLREEDLARADNDLVWYEQLHAEGFVQKNEYDAKKLAKQRAEIQLKQAERDRDLKVRFGNRRRLAELQADIETTQRDIDKTEKQAAARLADFEAARESARYVLDRERQQLEEMKAQVSKSKIYAPTSGLLVYARERSRWGSGDIVAEGDEVRERQEIATIPRQGGMTVKASIHETKLKKIRVGQPCVVTVEAFPGKTFEGHVEFVAVMADSGSWRSNPNQRLYKADISLANPTREMRPGMSCSVEILIDDLSDVTYIPRQSVNLDGGQTIVFVVENGQALRREVEVGLDNSKWVQIKSGLEKGEIVALAPPADFEPAPLEQDPTSGAMPFGSAKSKFDKAAAAKAMSRAGREGGQTGRPDGSSGGARPGGFDRSKFMKRDGDSSGSERGSRRDSTDSAKAETAPKPESAEAPAQASSEAATE